MSIVTQLHGLKYFAPIAISRLYEHRAIFSAAAFASTPCFTPRPSIHMPKQASPEYSRVSYARPRVRSKSEQSPSSKEKHGFLNRYADNSPAAASTKAPYAKTPSPKSIPAGLAY